MFAYVDAGLLKKNRTLDTVGLQALFMGESSPLAFDIKSDAEELFNKWARQDFEIDLCRGLIAGKPRVGNTGPIATKLDPKFKSVSPKYYGNGSLINGQWWPLQMATLRDGAHGSTQGGIFGAAGKGAY